MDSSLTLLLLDDYQRFGVWVVVCGLRVPADEVDIVVYPDYLAARVGLDIAFGYLPRLIVKEAVRIAAPSHAPHIHSITCQANYGLLIAFGFFCLRGVLSKHLGEGADRAFGGRGVRRALGPASLHYISGL